MCKSLLVNRRIANIGENLADLFRGHVVGGTTVDKMDHVTDGTVFWSREIDDVFRLLDTFVVTFTD